MITTLREARAEARLLRQQGDFAGALRSTSGSWPRILQTTKCARSSRTSSWKPAPSDVATQVYRTVAIHDIRAGHPLPALVACQALTKLRQPIDDIETLLVRIFASGSPRLSSRSPIGPAPVECNTKFEAGNAGHPKSLQHAAEQALRAALNLSGFRRLPRAIPSAAVSFRADPGIVHRSGALAYHPAPQGRRLWSCARATWEIRYFLVASGELRVFVNTPAGPKDVARLFENTLFGEMALITGQPRTASVAVVGDDVIEVSKAALMRLIAGVPSVREALDRFSRERLIKNLLQTSPLFAPFTKSQQGELLRQSRVTRWRPGSTSCTRASVARGSFSFLRARWRT